MHPKVPGHQKPSRARPPGRSHVPSQAAVRPNAKPAETETVQITANEYIVPHYPFGYLGGIPRRLELKNRVLWIVPILLTSPGYGAVGEVGVLAIDARTGQVVGSTPREEVVAAGKRLREAKRDELEAAFRRARTV
jgi:hypothetical protein